MTSTRTMIVTIGRPFLFLGYLGVRNDGLVNDLRTRGCWRQLVVGLL